MTLSLIENSQDIELKFTQKPGGYWCEDSVNQEMDSKLWAELVPSSGKAETIHGELLRTASKIYRDTYQNGGGNIVEFEDDGYSCDHCDYYETDEDERVEDHSDICHGDWIVTDYYQEYFDLLHEHLSADGRECLNNVKQELIIGLIRNPSIEFDRLVDYVIHTILTTENQPLPQTA